MAFPLTFGWVVLCGAALAPVDALRGLLWWEGGPRLARVGSPFLPHPPSPPRRALAKGDGLRDWRPSGSTSFRYTIPQTQGPVRTMADGARQRLEETGPGLGDGLGKCGRKRGSTQRAVSAGGCPVCRSARIARVSGCSAPEKVQPCGGAPPGATRHISAWVRANSDRCARCTRDCLPPGPARRAGPVTASVPPDRKASPHPHR